MSRLVCIVLLLCAMLLPPAQAADNTPSSPVWELIVSCELKDQPLTNALDVLFSGTGMRYEIAPYAASVKVTAVLKNVTKSVALREILKAAGVGRVTRGNTTYIYFGGELPSRSPAEQELDRKRAELRLELAREKTNKTDDHPTVKKLEAQIAEVEKQLDQEWELTWQQIMSVPRPTGDVFPITTESGMSTSEYAKVRARLSQLSGQLRSMMRRGASEEEMAQLSAEMEELQASLPMVKAFTVNYINPAELVPLIYALGAQQVTVFSGGKLVINGTDEVIYQADKIIRELDTETALPRPVHIEVRVSYIVSLPDEKAESVDASAVGEVAEGEPIGLKTQARSRALQLYEWTELTPVVGPDNRITLTGKTIIDRDPGIYRFPRNVIAAGQASSPVAITVVDGETYTISSGKFAVAGLWYDVEYKIEATTTVGKDRLRRRNPADGMTGGYGGGSVPTSPHIVPSDTPATPVERDPKTVPADASAGGGGK